MKYSKEDKQDDLIVSLLCVVLVLSAMLAAQFFDQQAETQATTECIE